MLRKKFKQMLDQAKQQMFFAKTKWQQRLVLFKKKDHLLLKKLAKVLDLQNVINRVVRL